MGDQEEPEALCEGDCEVQDARIAVRGVPARGDSNNRVCNRVLHRICHRIYSNNGPQDERTDQSWIDIPGVVVRIHRRIVGVHGSVGGEYDARSQLR